MSVAFSAPTFLFFLQVLNSEVMFSLLIKPFLTSHNAQNNIITFDYLHSGRAPVTIEVDLATHLVSWRNPCGLRTAFDAEVIEHGNWECYRLDDNISRELRENPRVHRFLFRNLHSVFGVPQPIAFTKVAVGGVWRARHPKYREDVYLVHKKVRMEDLETPIPHFDASQVYPLSGDHDFQML